MKVETASIDDLEEVITWIRTEEDCRTWAGPAVTFPVETARLVKEISFLPENTFCCKSDAGLLAFGQILPMADGRCHLARIITNPDFRSQGYGRQLCQALVDHAVRMGYGVVSLNVYSANTRAKGLYESLGFIEHAEHSDGCVIHMRNSGIPG